MMRDVRRVGQCSLRRPFTRAGRVEAYDVRLLLLAASSERGAHNDDGAERRAVYLERVTACRPEQRRRCKKAVIPVKAVRTVAEAVAESGRVAQLLKVVGVHFRELDDSLRVDSRGTDEYRASVAAWEKKRRLLPPPAVAVGRRLRDVDQANLGRWSYALDVNTLAAVPNPSAKFHRFRRDRASRRIGLR